MAIYHSECPPSSEMKRRYEYFVPGDGIDGGVIASDICRYLGADARMRPGIYLDLKTGRTTQGHYIRAYRTLSSDMKPGLKADSAHWESKGRDIPIRLRYTYIGYSTYSSSSIDTHSWVGPGSYSRSKPSRPITLSCTYISVDLTPIIQGLLNRHQQRHNERIYNRSWDIQSVKRTWIDERISHERKRPHARSPIDIPKPEYTSHLSQSISIEPDVVKNKHRKSLVEDERKVKNAGTNRSQRWSDTTAMSTKLGLGSQHTLAKEEQERLRILKPAKEHSEPRVLEITGQSPPGAHHRNKVEDDAAQHEDMKSLSELKKSSEPPGVAIHDQNKLFDESFEDDSNDSKRSSGIYKSQINKDLHSNPQEVTDDQLTGDFSGGISLASASDLPSLTADTTDSSSRFDFAEVEEELVQLILGDEELYRLLSAVVQRTSANKIEQNYTRLLRQFAKGLREEAKTPVERNVARLVKVRKHSISQALVATIDPSRLDRAAQTDVLLHQAEGRGEKIEGYLQPFTDNYVLEAKTTDALPTLSQLKAFILSSNALVVMRKRLTASISPRSVPEIPDQSNDHSAYIEEPASNFEVWFNKVLRRFRLIDQGAISTFFKVALQFSRPRIPMGHQRITWVCGCGKPMYSDVQELHGGGAAHIEQKLRRAAATAAAKSQGTPSGNSATTQRQGTSSSSNSALSGSTIAPQSGTPRSSGPSGGTQNGNLNPSPTVHGVGPPREDRFLIVCVNGPSLARHTHLSVHSGVDDQVLFQDIRRSYANLRRDIIRNFHPDTPILFQKLVKKMDGLWYTSQKLTADLFKKLKLGWLVWWLENDVFWIPKSAQFVRFQLVPVRMNITPRVLERCLPPEDEVKKQNYHYSPCPPDVRDQTLGLPFLHVLLEPGNHLDDFWTNHMPKKLKQELKYQSGPDPVIGWGVHIVEGPNWHALAVLTVLFIIMSLVLALVYSFMMSDVSSGFTVGSFALAAETLVVTLVLTVIITSIPQNG